MTPLGAVVLCGGRSSRMGRSKAWLELGGEPMLQRVVRRIRGVTNPVVVVAAPGQQLPELPATVHIARDPVEGRGPLQGIAVGLAALANRATYAFVCSTDAPFIEHAFVQRLHALCLEGGHDIAVPRVNQHHHPLSAVYATSLHIDAAELIANDKRRPFFLFQLANTRVVDRDTLLRDPALAEADPELRSLGNLNTPAEYEAALEAEK